MADDLFYASPATSHPSRNLPHSTDLDIDSFFAHDSPSASASSPPCRNSHRSHPPLRHRRCLFGATSPTRDQPIPKLPPLSIIPPDDSKSCKKRGAYNCGKCGQPKRGHVCLGEAGPLPDEVGLQELQATAPKRQPHPVAQVKGPQAPTCDQNRIFSSACSLLVPSEVSFPISTSSMTCSCSSNERSKRALQHVAAISESAEASAVAADADASAYSENSSYDLQISEAKGDQVIPLACLVHILSRLPPSDLVAASNVCRRWRQSAEYVWTGIRKTSISVEAPNAEDDFLPFILRKCSSLQELTLNVTRPELGDSLLRCISHVTPYLLSFEVSSRPGGSSTITGKGLMDLLRQCKTLTSVKFEGCDHVTEVELSSSRLTTLWLIGCHRLKYMFLNCPELSELCLDFLPSGHTSLPAESSEYSDRLSAIMKNLGCNARGLTRLHVASPWLQDRVIYGLFSPGLTRSLRMLSLTFGSSITDHSVAAIAANCENLELLDLSGSSITDVAIELISNSFSTSLAKLLIALCPGVSQDGLHMVVAKLPLLEVLDCGKVIVDENHTSTAKDEVNAIGTYVSRTRHAEFKDRDGELQFHHQNLQKLSLWGCAGLEALSLDCPKLLDLNLTGCSKLEPGRLQLLCPSLTNVHVGKCGEDLLCEIECQLELAHLYSKPVRRGLGDGSKRVQAPNVAGMGNSSKWSRVSISEASDG